MNALRPNDSFVHSRILMADRNFYPQRLLDGKNHHTKWDMFFGGFPNQTLMWQYSFLKTLREYNTEKKGIEGVFDPALTCCEDLDASTSSLTLSQKHHRGIAFDDSIGYFYICHPDSITGNHSSKQWMTYRAQMIKNHTNGLFSGIISDLLVAKIVLTADMPWSLMHFLPEPIKARLRGPRDSIKKALHVPTTLSQRVDQVLSQIPEKERLQAINTLAHYMAL